MNGSAAQSRVWALWFLLAIAFLFASHFAVAVCAIFLVAKASNHET
jgi:hypothetical protein